MGGTCAVGSNSGKELTAGGGEVRRKEKRRPAERKEGIDQD